jgi:hypothetical protein
MMAEADERIRNLRSEIMVLEWDQQRNQLNMNKVAYLNRLKEELTSLENPEASVVENTEEKA